MILSKSLPPTLTLISLKCLSSHSLIFFWATLCGSLCKTLIILYRTSIPKAERSKKYLGDTMRDYQCQSLPFFGKLTTIIIVDGFTVLVVVGCSFLPTLVISHRDLRVSSISLQLIILRMVSSTLCTRYKVGHALR